MLASEKGTCKGEFADLFDKLNAQGYSRVKTVVHPLTDPPKLKKQEKHDIEVVVDRPQSAAAKRRLADSVETALTADGCSNSSIMNCAPASRAKRFEKLSLPQRARAGRRRPGAVVVR